MSTTAYSNSHRHHFWLALPQASHTANSLCSYNHSHDSVEILSFCGLLQLLLWWFYIIIYYWQNYCEQRSTMDRREGHMPHSWWRHCQVIPVSHSIAIILRFLPDIPNQDSRTQRHFPLAKSTFSVQLQFHQITVTLSSNATLWRWRSMNAASSWRPRLSTNVLSRMATNLARANGSAT